MLNRYLGNKSSIIKPIERVIAENSVAGDMVCDPFSGSLVVSFALKNMGFKIEEVLYPYLTSPYSRPVRDHIYFGLSLLGFRPRFAFWRNIMEIYAKKQKK